MWNLSLKQLADITDGRVCFSSLPPLAGDCEPIRRIVLDSSAVNPGDIFWDFDGNCGSTNGHAEQALMRGGLGIVTSGRHIEPWAGRFVMYVKDTNQSLSRVYRCCPHSQRGSTFVWGEQQVAAS